jgi:hypothetical protein
MPTTYQSETDLASVLRRAAEAHGKQEEQAGGEGRST